MRTNMFFIWLWLIFSCVSFSQAKDWRGIVPLKSTRTDVERLLGNPKEPNGRFYDLGDEGVEVYYSTGSCDERWGGWKAPRDTVIELTVYFRTQRSLTDFRIDEHQYKKEIDPHSTNYTTYINKDEGISFYVNTSSGLVINAVYYPEAKYNSLLCPRSDAESYLPSRKTDEYLEISFKEEREHLDQFANELTLAQQYQSSTKGYIIVYPRKGKQADRVKKQVARAKSYMVKTHGIKATSIETIIGGFREESLTELWIRPPGYNVPPVFSTK